MKLLEIVAEEIQNLRIEFKKGLKPKIHSQHLEIYKRLLIFYCVYKDEQIQQVHETEWNKIYLALNTLNLAGGLDGIDISPLEVDLAKLFNPTGPLSPPKQGIKLASRFVPIDGSGKQTRRSDRTFLAVDTEKGGTFFVQTRDSSKKALHLFASKIARRVSAKHFASDRRLTNDYIASKALPGYRIPLVTKEDSGESVYKKIARGNKIISGLGIIDETCCYIGEQDKNVENLGLSSENLDEAYMTKIDYDLCAPDYKGYENRPNFKKLLYDDEKSSADSSGYELERLQTRLKLSLFTKELLTVDARKCYAGETEPDQMSNTWKALEERNTEILSLLNRNKDTIKNLMKENKISLENIYAEVTDYFINHDSKHLSSGECEGVIKSIYDRMQVVIGRIFEADKTCKEYSTLNRNINTCFEVFKSRLVAEKRAKSAPAPESKKTASKTLTEVELKEAIEKYHQYKNKVPLRRFCCSSESSNAQKAMLGEIQNADGEVIARAIDDKRRYRIATEYLAAHPTKKAFADELRKVMRP